MFNKKVLTLIAALSVTGLAFAEEAKQEVKAEAQAGAKTDEADQVITNRRLRAASGSLSRWSGNFSMNYQGGSLKQPIGRERPNITAGADQLTEQYFAANLGVKYRFSQLNSLTLATGVFSTTPFQKHQTTVSDPNLIYTNLAKFWGIQSVTQVTPTLITNSQQRDLGYRSSLDVMVTLMKEVGQSGFSFGSAFEWTGYQFDKSAGTALPNGGKLGSRQASNVWAIYPVAEYVLNDTYNLRTVFGWQVYQQTRGMAWDTYTKRVVYQSLGLGVSLTRDIFLYPNIQFIPSDIRQDRTNLGLSAYINVF